MQLFLLKSMIMLLATSSAFAHVPALRGSVADDVQVLAELQHNKNICNQENYDCY
jgi:hypothetical protein